MALGNIVLYLLCIETWAFMLYGLKHLCCVMTRLTEISGDEGCLILLPNWYRLLHPQVMGKSWVHAPHPLLLSLWYLKLIMEWQ